MTESVNITHWPDPKAPAPALLDEKLKDALSGISKGRKHLEPAVVYHDTTITAPTYSELELMLWHWIVLENTRADEAEPVQLLGAAAQSARESLIRQIPLTENQREALATNHVRGRRMPHLARKGLVRRRDGDWSETPHYELTALGAAIQTALIDGRRA